MEGPRFSSKIFMLRKRIIPTLLFKNRKLVKGRQFENHIYVGDPSNAIRILSNSEMDEIAIISIDGDRDLKFIEKVTSESFIPISVGGKIRDMDDVSMLITEAGADKVILNSGIMHNRLAYATARRFGSQSLICCIDIKRKEKDYIVFIENGKKRLNKELFNYVKYIEESGAGEIILQIIDREGMFCGSDLGLIAKIRKIINCNLGISGGISSTKDLIDIFLLGSNAAYVGSMVTFRKNNRNSILISAPNRKEIDNACMQKMYNG